MSKPILKKAVFHFSLDDNEYLVVFLPLPKDKLRFDIAICRMNYHVLQSFPKALTTANKTAAYSYLCLALNIR